MWPAAVHYQQSSQSTPLQSMLSSASAGESRGFTGNHHPITCSGALEYDGDILRCEHSETLEDDPRMQHVLTSTVAILLFELAHERFGTTDRNL